MKILFAPFKWFFRLCGKCWRGYKNLYHEKPFWKKMLLAIVSFILFLVLSAVAIQNNFLWLFGDSPSLSEIKNPKNNNASEVYSKDGKLLHKFFNENRTPVTYQEIPENFIHALIDTEDERFYKHMGIDFYGIGSALKDAAQGNARGASTITQQLVKNIHKVRSKKTGLLGYIPGVKILVMKAKEMIIATEVECLCSKEEILTRYCNTVDFGSNAYGIKTAAKTYFGKQPSELTTDESAILVGLLKATTAYNPLINPKRSLERRNVVLENMVSHGDLTRIECERLKSLPIDLHFTPENAFDGKALYFRQAVLDEIRDVAPEIDPYSDGVKIYTTLDSRMQDYAEEAVRKQMARIQENFNGHWSGMDPWVDEKGRTIPGFLEAKIKNSDTYKYLAARYPDNPEMIRMKLNEVHTCKLFAYNDQGYIEKDCSSMDSLRYMLHFMHTGFIAIEPGNGDVRAYVGDVDFKTWQHDNVKAGHQPGSTFKLFVYTTAIKHGLRPGDHRRDQAVELPVIDENGHKTIWRPHNANGTISGRDMTLTSAFAHSINTVAVNLGQEVGITNIIQTAKDMGIKSPLDNTPSLALGSSDCTPYELISAYGTVANYGTHVKPHCIDRIVDADGKEIYRHTPDSHIALNKDEAYYVQSLLAAGVQGGTSSTLGAEEYLRPYMSGRQLSVGGKTGTSNSHADAWFVGVTPHLVAGAWVGGEYRQIHFRTGALGQGSRTALPIVGRFLRKVLDNPELRDKYLATYNVPSGVDPNSLTSEIYEVEPDTTEVDSTIYENDGLDAVLNGEESQSTDPQANPAPAQPARPSEQRDPQDPSKSSQYQNVFD